MATPCRFTRAHTIFYGKAELKKREE